MLHLSNSVLDDFDHRTLVVFKSFLYLIRVSQVLEHKIEAAEIAILAKSYIKRFESESENLFD